MNWYRPAVMAGKLYPKEKQALLRLLSEVCPPTLEQEKALAVFVPHSDLKLSGEVAGDVFSKVVVPDTVIVLSPNHTGRGPFLSFWDEGNWETPLGKVPVDDVFAEKFRLNAGEVNSDMLAHLAEHAIEVQLPFLKYKNPNVKVVPVVLGPLRSEACKKVGEALAKTIGERKDVLIVVCNDMSLETPEQTINEREAQALEKIKAIDPEGLYQLAATQGSWGSGFVPMVVTLFALRALKGQHKSMADAVHVFSYASGYFH